MTLFETIAEIARPEGTKPVIQMIIEKSKFHEFDYNAEAIECHIDDNRLFVFPIQEHDIKVEWIYDQENMSLSDEDYDRAEIDLISKDKSSKEVSISTLLDSNFALSIISPMIFSNRLHPLLISAKIEFF